jgi:hypothetical protein
MDLFPLGNPDGLPAGWTTAEVFSTLGHASSQGVVEQVPTGPTQACPGGAFVIDAQHGNGFGTFTDTYEKGDQLYSQVSTGTLCFDSVGGFTGSNSVIIVGGTGKFAEASGTFEESFTGFVQAFDPNAKPLQTFVSFTGKFTGTLTLPNGEEGGHKDD